MEDRFFSSVRKYSVLLVKYLFFLFNLSLLVGLGIKTVKLWISDPFDFSDTLNTFSDEPEWLDRKSAETQLWTALSLETLLFVIGGFLCYELLIRQKTFRRSLIAPLALAFLFAAGESIPLFLPATEKVHQIIVCKALNISWDVKDHRCHIMDLELKRFEALKTRKKRKPVSAKPAVPVGNKESASVETPKVEKKPIPAKTGKPAANELKTTDIPPVKKTDGNEKK
ncbi:MAG: hypothetical protein IKR09_07585 [Alphaproteobacteria bacterium]|nr:hypothetical protein [Alphaproteobacteria bacterium]